MESITGVTEVGEITQFIVVKLGSEQYGIDISYVDNIIRMQKITRVPSAQHYFNGIINLRGEIVPVMSIRKKMGFEEDVVTNASRIIVLKIQDLGKIGIMVDEVKEVVNLVNEEIEKPSHDSKEGKNTYINGIGKNEGELISIFDIAVVVADE